MQTQALMLEKKRILEKGKDDKGVCTTWYGFRSEREVRVWSTARLFVSWDEACTSSYSEREERWKIKKKEVANEKESWVKKGENCSTSFLFVNPVFILQMIHTSILWLVNHLEEKLHRGPKVKKRRVVWWRRRWWWWWWSHQNLFHKKQREGRVISMLPFPSPALFKQICFLVMHCCCCCCWTDLKSSSSNINCKHTKGNTWILMKIHMTSKYEKGLCFCLSWQNILLKILHPEKKKRFQESFTHPSFGLIIHSCLEVRPASFQFLCNNNFFFSQRGNQREKERGREALLPNSNRIIICS